MANRDRVAEIAEKKRHGPKPWRKFQWEFQKLQRHWDRVKAIDADTDEFFIVKVVTLLEVFSRHYLARVIDHGLPYAERAIQLKTDLKVDLAFVRAIQGRVITMGDMVANGVSISSFSHIVNIFETVLGQDLLALISPASRRLEVWERHKKPSRIIADVTAMTRTLSHLFEVRHILCHEIRECEPYDSREISGFLMAAEQFAAAMTVSLDYLLYGDVPETIEERTAETQRSLAAGELLLAEVFGRVEGECDAKHHRMLVKSQRTWHAFREAQAAFRGDCARGGTAAPLLRALEADDLTQQRIESLRRFLPDYNDPE